MSEESANPDVSNMIAQMQARLSQHNATAGVATVNIPVPTPTPVSVSTDVKTSAFVDDKKVEFWETLPSLADDEFLLSVEWDGCDIIFCVKELDWRTAMDIEARAFRLGEMDKAYFSGESEKRETLSKAIIWAAEIESKKIITNKNRDILYSIHHLVIEQLWIQYYPRVTLDAKEANALYTAAKNYFTGKSQGGYPTIALITEVDMMCKPLVSMSLSELRAIKASDFDRIKLILMAREECLGLVSNAMKSQFMSNNTSSDSEEDDLSGYIGANRGAKAK